MAYAVTAEWVARPDTGDEIAELLATVAERTRAEPGCLYFSAQRLEDDPRTFLLYELFADPAALEAHRASEHVQTIVSPMIFPRLESRTARRWLVLDH